MLDPNGFNILRAIVGAGVIYFMAKLLVEGGGAVWAAVAGLPLGTG